MLLPLAYMLLTIVSVPMDLVPMESTMEYTTVFQEHLSTSSLAVLLSVSSCEFALLTAEEQGLNVRILLLELHAGEGLLFDLEFKPLSGAHLDIELFLLAPTCP